MSEKGKERKLEVSQNPAGCSSSFQTAQISEGKGRNSSVEKRKFRLRDGVCTWLLLIQGERNDNTVQKEQNSPQRSPPEQ